MSTEDYPVLAYVPDVPVTEVEDIVMAHWGEEDGTLRGRLAEELVPAGPAFDAFAAQLSIGVGTDLERLEEAFVEFDRALPDAEIEQLLDQPVREISLQLQQRLR